MTSQVEVSPLTGLIHFFSGKRRVNSKYGKLLPVRCESNWLSGGHRFDSCQVWQHSSIDYKILSVVILSLWLKNGICQFLAEECAQVLVNHLED